MSPKMKWPVNEAKSRFSDLLRQAEDDGPQVITRHGRERIVVLSIDEFRKLKAAQPSFRDYLRSGPKVDEFDVTRSDDTGRDFEL